MAVNCSGYGHPPTCQSGVYDATHKCIANDIMTLCQCAWTVINYAFVLFDVLSCTVVHLDVLRLNGAT